MRKRVRAQARACGLRGLSPRCSACTEKMCFVERACVAYERTNAWYPSTASCREQCPGSPERTTRVPLREAGGRGALYNDAARNINAALALISALARPRKRRPRRKPPNSVHPSPRRLRALASAKRWRVARVARIINAIIVVHGGRAGSRGAAPCPPRRAARASTAATPPPSPPTRSA